MKYTILILFFLLFGCRSSSSSVDSSLSIDSIEQKMETKEEMISLEKSDIITTCTSIQTDIDEEITLITFDIESGNLESIQTIIRHTGRNKSVNNLKQQNEVSLLTRKDSIEIHSETDIYANDHRESKGDSRTVQGIEWLYVIIGVASALLILVYGLLTFIRKRK